MPEATCCCLQICNLIRCHGVDVIHMYIYKVSYSYELLLAGYNDLNILSQSVA